MKGPYPRTDAENRVWADYERACALERTGLTEDAKNLLWALLDDHDAPLFLKQQVANLLTKINRAAISSALASKEKGVRFEGEIAERLANAGVAIIKFQEKIGVNGSITDIDLETRNCVIEITIRQDKKVEQVTKLFINDRGRNPNAKLVVLYGEKYLGQPAVAVTRAGGLVVNTFEGLISVLQQLRDVA